METVLEYRCKYPIIFDDLLLKADSDQNSMES